MTIESRSRDRLAITELPAEVQLICATAAGVRGDARVAELTRGTIAWPVVAAIADRERAVPALAAALKRAAPAVWASPGVEPLRRLAMVAAFESTRLETKLAALLEAYGAEGIEVVLLKGAGLALQRHGTLGGRPSRDLDLLIAPARISRAYELAQADPNRRLNVKELREKTGISRHLSVPLVEYFDQIGLTRRDEIGRHFRRDPRQVFDG